MHFNDVLGTQQSSFVKWILEWSVCYCLIDFIYSLWFCGWLKPIAGKTTYITYFSQYKPRKIVTYPMSGFKCRILAVSLNSCDYLENREHY